MVSSLKLYIFKQTYNQASGYLNLSLFPIKKQLFTYTEAIYNRLQIYF